MNHMIKQGFFPGFPIFTGMLGFGFRCWLLSTADGNGLLQNGHIAGILSFVLLALTLAVCFLAIRRAAPADSYRKLFPASEFAAIGTALGAIGIAFTAFVPGEISLLRLIMPLLGILSAAALFFSGYCRLKGMRPNFMMHGVVATYLILRTLAGCRAWGAEPQLQLYFFQLLACLFALIACYYRAEMDISVVDCRKYVFFSQAALFCCCLCLTDTNWLFYLSVGIWLAADYCVLPTSDKGD